MRIPDRARARIGRIKADRSTKLGVAGHKAAMEAYGRAAGWKRITTSMDSKSYSIPTVESNVSKKAFPVGDGGVSTIESNVIDRHKPTEDF